MNVHNRMRTHFKSITDVLQAPRGPWVMQDLDTLWDSYMREIWRSTSELSNFMKELFAGIA
jgi:hypothetical protein